MRNGLIYKIISPTGRIYIGQTLDFNKRLCNYRILNCKGQKLLYNSFKKHGFNSHIFEILESEISNDLIDEREIHFIHKEKAYFYKHKRKGMNLTLGGKRTFGYTHSEETKAKIGKTNGKIRVKGEWKIPEHLRMNIGKLVSRPVCRYSKDGILLQEYSSITEAGKEIEGKYHTVNSAISKCCKGKEKTYKGFIWKYKIL